MSSPSPRLSSTRRFAVIFVCDLEDYSLWCQTVESSCVAALGKRLMGTAALLSEMLGGEFVKSTGDGVIGIWAHDDDQTEEDGHVPMDEAAVARDVHRACMLAMALQLLTQMGFGFDWPIPRQLRCAVHVGAVHRLAYTRFDGSMQVDFVGEALNAACRLEKLGADVKGAVLSEHAFRVLARSGRGLLMELPQRGVTDLKSAQWLGKRVYGLPSATLLSSIREVAPPDERGVDAFEAKFRENSASFVEGLFFEMLVAMYEAAAAHPQAMDPNSWPEWLRKLPQHVSRVVRDPHQQLDRSLAADLPASLRKAYERFQREVDPSAPGFVVIRALWDAELAKLDPTLRALALSVFPPARRKGRRKGS